MTVAEHPVPSRHGHPAGLLRLLLKAPVPLFRAGLGWIFGRRLLMITHEGRRTGTLYRTAVEVVHYDRQTHESIVTAGWGAATQWYRNIQAKPPSQVCIGRDRYTPVQRFLGEQEARDILDAYSAAHPLAGRLILRWLGYEWDQAGRERFFRTVRLVAFRPRGLTPAAQRRRGL